MKYHDIKEEISLADNAINTRDFDGLLVSYAPEAALVVTPDQVVKGHDKIKEAFHRIDEYFNGSLKVSQGDIKIIEAGDTALVIAKTFVESPKKLDSKYPAERESVYVYKRDEKGKWRCVIDNSYGVEVLKSMQ